jgi:hypothetical protein
MSGCWFVNVVEAALDVNDERGLARAVDMTAHPPAMGGVSKGAPLVVRPSA